MGDIINVDFGGPKKENKKDEDIPKQAISFVMPCDNGHTYQVSLEYLLMVLKKEIDIGELCKTERGAAVMRCVLYGFLELSGIQPEKYFEDKKNDK